MIDTKAKKDKIVSFLESNGPSLPVRISGVIEMEPVFASAFLSELYSEQRIKMSNLRVGSSHLYFLPGQEAMLENFSENLKQPEKEALNKLKAKKILIDEEESPATRVALGGMNDFAKSFSLNEKKMWRYAFASDEEINEILNPKKKEEAKKEKKEEEIEIKIEKKDIAEEKVAEKPEEKKIKKDSKEVEANRSEAENIFVFDEVKSEFLDEVEKFLSKKGIVIYEKIQVDKKEVVGKVSFQTSVGELKFLLVARNKKSVSKDEISGIVQKVNYHKMPCLLVIRKEAPKALQNLLKENNLIKTLAME